jgi:signal transduction histidine kinase
MQIEFIRHIQDASRHMNELVTNLLEMARMEMGIGLNLEELEINQLLAELEEEFRPQAGLKNHQLIFDLSNECLIVYGDEKRLQQVVRNLLGNAIKYTPDGGMIILRSQMNDGEVDVSIMDNGIGIPEEELTNLFQKFYRVRRKETNDIEGSGLGLAIVKSIVERHNGKIRVESALGRGSCFRFSLPRVAA